MSVLPDALIELIEALGSLPGVGPRTAERYAYFILKAEPHIAHRISETSRGIHQRINYCEKTFALIPEGQRVSALYENPSRDKSVIAIVAEPFDIIALEKTGQFNGTYHVLGGVISPIDDIGPEQLHIPELLNRVKEDGVREIIIALNASVEGESTALYLQKAIGETGDMVKISRLARGLPVGIDLEYADQITLRHALEGRTEL